MSLSLHTAQQHEPGETVQLNAITPASRSRRVAANRNGRQQPTSQQWLPGLEDAHEAES
jgi:hypothetical protein